MGPRWLQLCYFAEGHSPETKTNKQKKKTDKQTNKKTKQKQNKKQQQQQQQLQAPRDNFVTSWYKPYGIKSTGMGYIDDTKLYFWIVSVLLYFV